MFDLNYRKKRQLLIILLYSLILVLFVRGLQLHLAQKVTDRLRFHAIPIAISTLYHHHPHDYSGWRAIEMPFQGSDNLKDLIRAAVTQDLKNDTTNYYWVADDRGFTDFVIASFYLFGPHMHSMYYMWFLLLIVSVSLFLVSFHKQFWALGSLGFILLGMHVAISTLALSSVYAGSETFPTLDSLATVSLYETRFLDVLALVSVFHMIFLASRARSFKWLKDGLPLIGQIFLFVFLYHSRSSLGWELVAIFGYCFFHICACLYKKPQRKNIFTNPIYRVSSALAVFAILACSLLFLNVYKHMVYNPKYFEEMGIRTFWHNALMGLGSDSFFSNTYGLSVNDYAAAQSVIRFAQDKNLCTSDIEKMDPQVLLNSLGNWGVVNWINYERCAKKHFLSIVSNHKLKIVKLYLITKPLEALKTIKEARGKTENTSLEYIRNKYGIKWAPFNIINLSFLVLIFVLSFRALSRNFNKILFIMAVVLFTSFIPSVTFYPEIWTEGGIITILPIVLYLMFFMIIYQISLWLFHGKNSSNEINNIPWREKKELSIIIPAFNEEKHIALTILEVSNAAQKILDNYEIMVVDDGSSDETYAVALESAAQNPKITVIRNEDNIGVGGTFFLGLAQAKFPQLCLIPGDNAYHKTGVELIFSYCGKAPLVISYRENMEARTWLRFLLSRTATFSLRMITGFGIYDAHSLYLFPVEETRRLKVNSNGYGYHIEILSRLLKNIKSYIEVPVILNPKPDASSGVMKPKTLLILGITISKLFGLKLLGRL